MHSIRRMLNGQDIIVGLNFRLSDQQSVLVTSNGAPAGVLKTYIVRPGNSSFFRPWECKCVSIDEDSDDLRIEWQREDEGTRIQLRLRMFDAGFSGVFQATGRGHGIIRLVWELPADVRGFPFVPAFMYGHNEGGNSPRSTYPRLCSDDTIHWDKPWMTNEWLVRTDRSSHGLTSVVADDMVYAVGGRDVCRYPDGTVAEKTGLGISAGSPHHLTFSLGFGNVPYTYSTASGRNYLLRPDGYVDLEKGEVSAEFFLLNYESESRSKGASRLLKESYALLHDRVHEESSIEEGVLAISDALVDYGYSSEARNFHVTLFDDDRLSTLPPRWFNTAWAGGLRVAYPLLVAGRQMGNDRWLQCAREVLSNVADNAISEKSGLFYENYCLEDKKWSPRGWWYGALEKPGHSGYINGQACHYLLLAYLLEMHHPSWIDSARSVLDRVASTQGDDGRFGYTYSEEDGSILDGDGFSGCWFTPAFASLYRVTGDKKYLDVARRAMDFYRQYVEGFHVWGGPHDIFKSPDEEGILAWIEAARLLHEITGDEQFLTDLMMGLDYEFSWKFAYNVVNEIEPLKSKNWCSTGGSVTSVNNSHIHPMGSQIINSMLYAAEVTGDPYIKSRLVDTLKWTLAAYLHHDGDYGWGRKGMINERFCYTDSLLVERFPDGSASSTWFCAHSWASGAVLEGITGTILDRAGTEGWKCPDY